MKVLKILGYIVLGIIALFFIIPIFLPGEYSVSRSIEVNVPADSAFDYIVTFNERDKWDPWLELDPAAESKVTGGKWWWKGKVIGEGTLEVTKSEKPIYIESKLHFVKPNEMTSNVKWEFQPVDSNKVKLTWTNYGELSYPVERYYGLMVEEMLGKSFEKGLSNLKQNIED